MTDFIYNYFNTPEEAIDWLDQEGWRVETSRCDTCSNNGEYIETSSGLYFVISKDSHVYWSKTYLDIAKVAGFIRLLTTIDTTYKLQFMQDNNFENISYKEKTLYKQRLVDTIERSKITVKEEIANDANSNQQ